MDLFLKVVGQAVLSGFATVVAVRGLPFIQTDVAANINFIFGFFASQATFSENFKILLKSLMP